MFISASNDNTIRIWCLDKFTELYRFKLPEGLTNIKLMNSEKFACFYNDAIKIGKLRHLAKSFANPNAFIVKIGKCFQHQTDININNAMALYTLCDDNSVLIQSPTGKQLSTIYPPPTAKSVACLSYCMSLNRMFILLASGTLCIYKIDKETAILEKL